MAQVITSADQIDFTVDDRPSMPLPTEVLMVRPLHYSVDYVINPHMADQVGKVDKIEANNEWNLVRSLFDQIGMNINVIEDQEGLPDMVFCANQSLPYIDEDGNTHVFMSIMHADERKDEVPYIEQWYRQNGYKIHYLDEDKINDFEGCGDAIWHTGKRLLWGGYGYRSSLEAYETISDTFDVPILALELVDESFYHLDTCLCVLDEHTALIYPDAFTEEGLEMINKMFDKVIHASKYEAEKLFACNASCPDGRNVIIQQGCTDVNKNLRDHGFSVHEVSTYQFLKSGGSVFCMKMLLW
ncbi:dimethylarginine dimethylaminohydrolase family protein [Fodinibius sp.]|uniref:dimethylarginine dimethylaminohydrolase family protein n=1 Tax=Fodinibius sp. TaxID=1872440 RepID=UPI002ACECC8A|nr:arginine deiminase-related protein [Fodinibius sp.]MDZ7658189.1 arginine deiminase-related protein [Fodinibius sp.]